MSWRLQRSIKILPGLRLNLSRSGIGISAGPRGLKVGIDSRGRQYVNAGIPGTGLSTRHYVKTQPAPRLEGAAISTAAPSVAISPAPRLGLAAPLAVLGGLSILVGGFWLSSSSRPLTKHPPQPPAAVMPTSPVTIATAEIERRHPEYVTSLIVLDVAGSLPAINGNTVRLRYNRLQGAVTHFVCIVIGQTASCAERNQAAIVPRSTTAVGSATGLHVGPRGGVYHYSRSGRKAYERHHH
jgi:hypothetical protein